MRAPRVLVVLLAIAAALAGPSHADASIYCGHQRAWTPIKALRSPINGRVRGHIYWYRVERYNAVAEYFCRRSAKAVWRPVAGSSWRLFGVRTQVECWEGASTVYAAPCKAGLYGAYHARLWAYLYLAGGRWQCKVRVDAWAHADTESMPVSFRHQECWQGVGELWHG